MKAVLIITSILFPILMVYLHKKSNTIQAIINWISIISIIIFGNITATTIYQIIVDNAVFMTTIHGIFLNPFFLITGAYLGIYATYKLIVLTLDDS